MSTDKTEPRYNAARRIRWLAIGVVVAAVGLSVGWFGVARTIENRVDNSLITLAENGTAIDCPGRAVRGFPFRFGVFCDQISAISLASGAMVTAGAFRSAAQFYDPGHIVMELDAPFKLITPALDIQMDWAMARASVVGPRGGPDRLSMEFQDVSVDMAGLPVFAAGTATGHMRVSEPGVDTSDLDLVVSAVDVARAGVFNNEAGLPLFDADADLTITGGAALVSQPPMTPEALAGKQGEIRRLALLLTDDQGVLASGPFSISTDGLVTAELSLRVVDVEATRDALVASSPVFAAIASLIDALPRSGDRGDEAQLTISIQDGQMSFGIIPLGTLPPLF